MTKAIAINQKLLPWIPCTTLNRIFWQSFWYKQYPLHSLPRKASCVSNISRIFNFVVTIMCDYFAHAPKDTAFADANLERNVNQRGIIHGADDDTNEADRSSH